MDTTDPLAGAGLSPAEGVSPDPAPVPDPVVPAPTPQVAVDPAASQEEEEETVVPEGARNPDAVQRAIAAERKAAREANARRRQLEEELQRRVEGEKPLEERIAAAEREREAATLRALKYEVAAESGLNLQLATRLTGVSREELVADAETFKSMVGSSGPTAPPDGGVRTPPPAKSDPVQEHNALIGAILGGAQSRRGSRDPLAGLTPADE